MLIKGTKRGKNIELLEELDIPDEQSIIIEIQEQQLMNEKEKAILNPNQIQFSFSELLHKFRQEEHLEAAGIESAEILEDVRDSSPGREVVW
ncbi:hypothetical protein [Gloeocapsa sp. PCC 73106]|uniref:hypothetical protein n=1 Tax=Gloeocapsa sp. PCC 73106 TaxID=102232 RepID=UPI0002AD08EA|nr:hypothetical protein [Gloeocapsa sp. PCC 73106]ELS00217.1 hypothetical protein GLO73106DRAFT_00040730 [Gloeocapsa sp. PCC 73106]